MNMDITIEETEEVVEARYGRFKDAEWFGENRTIIIGGAGGTGSHLAFLLARSGEHTFYIYDDDVYEDHNCAGQFVKNSQIELNKATALKDNILDFAGDLKIYAYGKKYDESSPTNEICFACFDNMKARKIMYEKWKKYLETSEDKSKFLFVDLRLLAESWTILLVQGGKPEQLAKYEANLFDDSEVEDAECTLKQTTHAASMIASHTVGFFTNWISNVKEGADYRMVPFRCDYVIGPNYYTNEY